MSIRQELADRGLHLAEAVDLVAGNNDAIAIVLDIVIPPVNTVILHHVGTVGRVHKWIVDGCDHSNGSAESRALAEEANGNCTKES